MAPFLHMANTGAAIFFFKVTIAAKWGQKRG
jgi:hypothetical protein